MPVGTYTARVVMEQVSLITGNSPVTVDMLNDHVAIIELELDSMVVHMAQALQATQAWDGCLVEITCVVAHCHSVMHIFMSEKLLESSCNN